jgi:hypothetical protein
MTRATHEIAERLSAKADGASEAGAIGSAGPSARPPTVPGRQLPAVVSALLALPLGDDAKRLVRDLLLRHAGERVVLPNARTLAAARRFEVARSMLLLREPREAVRLMLMRRFGVSARQARREVAAALQVGQVVPPLGRFGGHDCGNEHQQENQDHASPF